jgi:hypothetical protein
MKKYKEQLEFWWAKKTIRDGRDFELQMDDAGMLVTLISGKFKGVQYRYSPLTVLDDEGLIDFRTFVEYAPKTADLTDPKFVRLTTNILRILLADAIPETAIQAKQENTQVIDENRDTDTDEPNQERDFHEESTPVLEKRVSKRKPRKKTVPTDSGIHPQVQQPAKPKRARARTTGKKRPHGK